MKLLNWLKSAASYVAAIALAFVAYRAAQAALGHRRAERHWQEESVRAAEKPVAERTIEAGQAIALSTKHAEAATRAAEQYEKRRKAVRERNETVADIVDRWRSDA